MDESTASFNWVDLKPGMKVVIAVVQGRRARLRLGEVTGERKCGRDGALGAFAIRLSPDVDNKEGRVVYRRASSVVTIG